MDVSYTPHHAAWRALTESNPMDSYSVRDVERVLQLSRSTIRGLIDGGWVKPTRGPRGQFRFSFQDLIVLRTARALTLARVPRRRILRSLQELRRHLPEEAPLSGLNICAVGDRVVVRDGAGSFQADDGQCLLELDVRVRGGVLNVTDRQTADGKATGARIEAGRAAVRSEKATRKARPQSTESSSVGEITDWFTEGLELEDENPRAAQKAYARAVDAEPANSSAWINWGRLLHEAGDVRQAESVYRRALVTCGPDPLLMFNLGVLLEDVGRTNAALEAYQSAIVEDPGLADCHYNLARLYESLGKQQHAIRHLGQYRRLLTSSVAR